MRSSETQLDNTIDIVTPENIAFQYYLAGPMRRLPAFLIDQALRIAAVIAAYTLVTLLTGLLALALPFLAKVIVLSGMAAFYLVGVFGFAAEILYGALFETYMNGQTPGKRMLGLRVVTTSGHPINGMQAVMRNLLRYADMMPLLPLAAVMYVLGRMSGEMIDAEAYVAAFIFPTFLIGLAAMTMTPRRQRLGDLVCRTIVVSEDRRWSVGLARLEDPRAPELAAYIPAKFEISRPLAKTLARYAERRLNLSDSRRNEIAQHLAKPLLERFGLPADTNYDLMLCAMYYRAFIADRGEETRSPFAAPRSQPPPPLLPGAPQGPDSPFGSGPRPGQGAASFPPLVTTPPSSGFRTR